MWCPWSLLIKLPAYSRSLRVGKSSVPLAPLIGVPYGSMFQLSADGLRLERLERWVLHALSVLICMLKTHQTRLDNINLAVWQAACRRVLKCARHSKG